jgi:hypothetical protein
MIQKATDDSMFSMLVRDTTEPVSRGKLSKPVWPGSHGLPATLKLALGIVDLKTPFFATHCS